MTLRYSEDVRNAGLDARVAAVGPSPTLRMFAESGTRLANIKLPAQWMSKAANGIIHKQGNWSGFAEAEGEAKRFEICGADGKPHWSGAIPTDMTLDNPDLKKGQSVMVGVFVIAAGNG